MTITTELVLVCHGQAACEVGGIVGGRVGCTGLAPTGRRQVHQLALRLAAEHDQDAFAALYTSPRARAVQTAAQLSAVLTLPATTVEELREPDPGKVDNRPWRDVVTAFGGPPQHRPDQPWAAGAEPWNVFLQRATSALNTVLTQRRRQRLIVVADTAIVEAAHVLLLGLQPEARLGLGFVTGPASVTRWCRHINNFGRTAWMLTAHNDTRHLTEDPQ